MQALGAPAAQEGVTEQEQSWARIYVASLPKSLNEAQLKPIFDTVSLQAQRRRRCNRTPTACAPMLRTWLAWGGARAACGCGRQRCRPACTRWHQCFLKVLTLTPIWHYHSLACTRWHQCFF